MGFRSVHVSDLSGNELSDDQVVNVVVRHPDLEEGRQFDASQEALKALKHASDLVSLELKPADGTSQEAFSTAAEFAKVVPAEKFKNFDQLRGRRKGFRPNADRPTLAGTRLTPQASLAQLHSPSFPLETRGASRRNGGITTSRG